MNLGEMQSAMFDRFDIEGDDARIRRIFTSMLNSGYSWLLAQRTWPWQLKDDSLAFTTASVAITLWSDFLAMQHVVHRETGVVLRQLKRTTAEIQAGAATAYLSRDYPRTWFTIGDYLYLEPNPGVAGNLDCWYWHRPGALAVAGDTPIFPAQFHEILIEHATMKFASQDSYDPLIARQAKEDRASLFIGMNHLAATSRSPAKGFQVIVGHH